MEYWPKAIYLYFPDSLKRIIHNLEPFFLINKNKMLPLFFKNIFIFKTRKAFNLQGSQTHDFSFIWVSMWSISPIED